MTDDAKLLPCPFCGATGCDLHLMRLCERHIVECDNCGTKGPELDHRTAAIAAWNRRAGGCDGVAWRDVLIGVYRAMSGQRVTVLIGETGEQREKRYADAGMRYLMSRTPADRIAMARELLEGTGRVVAKERGTLVPNGVYELKAHTWLEADNDTCLGDTP